MTRSAKLEVRLSAQEKAEIKARAERADLRLSEYVRRAALGCLGSDTPPGVAERSSGSEGRPGSGTPPEAVSGSGASAEDQPEKAERLAPARAVKAEAERRPSGRSSPGRRCPRCDRTYPVGLTCPKCEEWLV
jgi:hypothetical protein